MPQKRIEPTEANTPAPGEIRIRRRERVDLEFLSALEWTLAEWSSKTTNSPTVTCSPDEVVVHASRI
jgi:hypothetical protein